MTNKSNKKVFWCLESEYQNERKALESRCEAARTVADAIRAGASATFILDDTDTRHDLGCVGEDGESLEEYDAEYSLDAPVKFWSLGRDDGYTCAYFYIKKEGE